MPQQIPQTDHSSDKHSKNSNAKEEGPQPHIHDWRIRTSFGRFGCDIKRPGITVSAAAAAAATERATGKHSTNSSQFSNMSTIPNCSGWQPRQDRSKENSNRMAEAKGENKDIRRK